VFRVGEALVNDHFHIRGLGITYDDKSLIETIGVSSIKK
jgi:hypothetical protein